MYISSEDRSVFWWQGKVISSKGDTFVIDYEEEDEEVSSSVSEYPLLFDYYVNEVRILT